VAHLSVVDADSGNGGQCGQCGRWSVVSGKWKVVDADSGDNGRFVCSVDNRNFALQQIYTSELKLVTSSRLHCYSKVEV